MDQDLEETPSILARVRLQTLGEIIPVMYNTHDHRSIVFRIGQRMFYCRTPTGDPEDEDSEDEDDIILGVLPCTYDEFSSNPTSIVAYILDRSIQRNLSTWHVERTYALRASAATAVFRIHDYQKYYGMDLTDDDTMIGWPEEEWRTRLSLSWRMYPK